MPSLISHPPAAQLSPGWGPGATAICVRLLSPCSGALCTEAVGGPRWCWGRAEAPGCPGHPPSASTSWGHFPPFTQLVVFSPLHPNVDIFPP